MSHSNLQHRRTHNLLLISKLLNQRDTASPFTLVKDSLEQPAKPLLREYIRRAKLSKTSVIFLSFETFTKPKDVDFFVECYGDKKSETILRDVQKVVSSGAGKRFLIIIDSLTTLCSKPQTPGTGINLVEFLSNLLQPSQPQQQTSLVAVYHLDIPTTNVSNSFNSYSPPPLSLLSYLATTIIKLHSLSFLLTEKAANARSLAAPAFGLGEEVEGVLVGLKPKTWSNHNLKVEERGLVLELEHRRKSGRGVLEWYFLPTCSNISSSVGVQAFREIVTLLDDHPLFRKPQEEDTSEQELTGMTFELGLTERQRLERDGVVLPYFDAQKGGGGEGGRILYDMGVEDDFDEEEDEI
ncbi:hypothetical protein PV10_06025 [Exophiala mesophila]|uniref:Elongator complex protein 5 n=1 Tax=Exophiala mesophila TaxID=212818 RepID=A0A0D1XTL9_EXOME|nr:uncharacterized protein PV10_06025 [Exophiala mesophila]KIV91491.1 hypothetical protein PV10_06025 [Exophiala mesophila]